MKKILFIATSNTFVALGGGLANKAFLQSILDVFPNQVDVIHPYVDKEVPNNFYLIPEYSKKKKILGLLHGIIHKYNPWVLEFIEKHKGEYSHCFINSGVFGDLVVPIQKMGIKVAVIHHNYEVEFQMDNKKATTFGGWFPYFVKRNEKNSYLLSNLNLFLTNSDKEKFIDIYGNTKSPCHVLGMYETKNKEIIEVRQNDIDRKKLVICGSLNSYQTLCGIKDFQKNCLQYLHNYYNEDFYLLITGRSPRKYICDLAASDPNITLIPSPKNISETISDCGIFICPTNVGGGIKLRIMDGLKLGMPIITHKISARGYDAFWGKPWFKIYDNDETFRTALKDLNEYIMISQNLREEILKEYNEYFSYDAGDKRFVETTTKFLED